MIKSKPSSCNGCALHERGTGFAQAVGPRDSLLCFVGEALGRTEAIRSEPFVGDAGVYLNRAFRRLGIEREQVRIGNVVSCQPPRDWLVGAPWEAAAIAQCFTHRRTQLAGHKVYVTLGVTATRVMLKELLDVDYRGKLEDWHGYVIGDEHRGYVVPTFHPAFLLRGNQKLFGTFAFDIRRAMETASFGYTPDTVNVIEDPSPAHFAEWVRHVPDDPAWWMAVDIETPDKGTDEGDLAPGFAAGAITRISFCYNPDQAVSVPFEPRYYASIRNALGKRCIKVFHNERYDVPILESNSIPVERPVYDSMWAWHHLQSDCRKGLGFVAPFYSNLPPWKHLNDERPAYYNGMDSLQTLRIMIGVAKHLKQYGQWDSFVDYCVDFDPILHEMTDLGVQLDKDRLTKLNKSIDETLVEIHSELEELFPKHLIPPDGGWKRQPAVDSPYHKDAYKTTIKESVLCCEDCGEIDVTPKHKCVDSPSSSS